jgi:hypothetical protein
MLEIEDDYGIEDLEDLEIWKGENNIPPPEMVTAVRGGIVRARRRGTFVCIGEAGRDEVLIPVGRNGATGGVW